MIAFLSALLALGTALPTGTAAYRFELSGEPVGSAELSVRCQKETCRVRFLTLLRLPEDAGGDLTTGEVEVETDRFGRSRGDPVRVRRDGEERTVLSERDFIPAFVVPLVFFAEVPRGGEPRCFKAFDEESGDRGRACGSREGSVLTADVLGVKMRVKEGTDGFPERIFIPEQTALFQRVAAAGPPDEPPRLFGVRLRGKVSRSTFCSVSRDGTSQRPTVVLPEPRAEGANCRARTVNWLKRAREAGFPGRVALGVAYDGEGLVWHAWAEVLVGGRYIPVDPTFGQLPASGPRFTIARYDPENPMERLDAGRRVLACWKSEAPEDRP